MSQTGFTPILIYGSTTTGNTPSASNLTTSSNGVELAINATDGKLFYKDNGGTVQVLATKGTGSIGGSNTQVQYNSSGALAGSANLTFNGTTLTANTLNLTNALGTGYGGTGLTSFTANQVFYASSTSAFAQSTNLQFNGTTLTTANDASIHGLTVGLGGGSVSTNTAVGASALANNSTGVQCVAIGGGAAYSSNTNFTTAIGYNAAYYVTGTQNTAIGLNALYGASGTTTGVNNVAVGHQSLTANTSGNYNTGLGTQSLYSNTTASNNTAVGYQAGYSNTTGTAHVAVGGLALYSNTTGTDNVAVGYNSLYSNTTGIQNVSVGRAANYGNNTGSNNTAVGYAALGSTGVPQTGSYNIAVGGQALQANTTASSNTALGYQAGYTNTTGTNNVFIGFQAGYTSNAPGTSVNLGYNTCVGPYAGYGLTTGVANCFIGSSTVSGPSTYGSGQYVTTGSYNTILGGYNGNQQTWDMRTTSNNIIVSDGSGYPGFGRVIVSNVSTSYVSISPYAGVGGFAMVTGYTSGGAQGTWLVTWQYNTASVVNANNGTGLTISFQASGGNLQIKTASGTLVSVSSVFLI